MKTFRIEYSPYSLKLKIPFATSKGDITSRSGFIIKVTDEQSNSGTGDCSPFPEFGSESLEEAEKKSVQLKSITLSDLQFSSIKDELINLISFPALKAGLEQALLELLSHNKHHSLMRMFGINSSREIPVNGVIGFLSPSESTERAKALVDSGYKTIKVKTGRDNFDIDYSVLYEIRNKVNDDIKIRIDSNGKWDLKSAIKYLNKLEQLKIEYAEQPVNSLEEYIELKKESSLPVAADESIRSFNDAMKFTDSDAIDYIIIKPMLLGGIFTSLEIIEQAKKSGIKTVVTSSFESAIGRKMDVLAAALVENNAAHGLSTADFFENDLMNPVDVVKNGIINLDSDAI
jgi:o-succinylbenzoate synthase